MRANKAIYEKYEDKKEGSGRKRKYGKKYLLNKSDSLPDPDYVNNFKFKIIAPYNGKYKEMN